MKRINTKKTRTKIFLLILIGNFLFQTRIVFAQPATPSSEPVEVAKEETESPEQEPKGFFGQIIDLFNRSIVLQTLQDKKTASLSEDVTIIDQKRQKISFEDLEMNSHIIAMGYTESPDELEATRVVVTQEPEKDNRVALYGLVTKVEKNSFNLLETSNNAEWKINLERDTLINEKIEEEMEKIEELQENNLVVVAGEEKNQEVTATRIRRLIPQSEKISSEEIEKIRKEVEEKIAKEQSATESSSGPEEELSPTPEVEE